MSPGSNLGELAAKVASLAGRVGVDPHREAILAVRLTAAAGALAELGDQGDPIAPVRGLVVADAARIIALAANRDTDDQAESVADEIGLLLDRIQQLLPSAYASPKKMKMPGQVPIHPDHDESRRVLDQIAADYGVDANRDDRDARKSYRVALLAAVAAIAILVTGAIVAGRDRSFNGAEFMGYGAAALFSAAIAWVMSRIAGRLRVESREAVRLRRQLAAVDAYLGRLPAMERDLLKGAMLGRLFPRLLDDDDPLRETPLPTTRELLDSISWSQDYPSVGSASEPAPRASTDG